MSQVVKNILGTCKCGSDEHWIPSMWPDRLYTCMLCHKPVDLETYNKVSPLARLLNEEGRYVE